MRQFSCLTLVFILFNSCIPLNIAPNIKDYKIIRGNRIKRSLPKKTVFVFEDTKDADEFYSYVNTKYNLEDYYVDVQVLFCIQGKTHYFSFYEFEEKDKTLNLVPLVIDVAFNQALQNEDFEPIIMTDDNTLVRKGNYYIAIEVFSDSEKDCLLEEYAERAAVLMYLRNLKKEYLSTHNYNEVVFKN